MPKTNKDMKLPTEEELQKILMYVNSSNDLWNGLMLLYSVQSTVSALVPGTIPALDQVPLQDQFRTYSLATMVEISELVQEFNWKPWKNSTKQLDLPKIADEFADVLAFLGILVVYMQRVGVTPRMIADAYANKTKINVRRLMGEIEGYGNGPGHSDESVA
jgi:NTP pyrophosphatase (non-canonical NTP hydrolase)